MSRVSPNIVIAFEEILLFARIYICYFSSYYICFGFFSPFFFFFGTPFVKKIISLGVVS